jgi:phospholipid-binding lipoprotein MlaA
MTTGALTVAVLAAPVLAPGVAWARARPSVASGTPGDPYERTNRGIYAFNRRLDRAFLAPLARLTTGLTPGPIGKAIHNFLVNLNEPVVIVNDLLQARPGPAVRSAFRLLVNSTVGGLGAIDVAKALGDPAHKNGFGDTLGRWGADPGPYLVVPVLGPSTFRDLLGSIADDFTLPLQFINYPYRTEVAVTVSIVGGLNERSELGPQLDALLGGAADPYATLRSSYLQSREAQIRGAKALPPLPEIDEVTPPPPPEVPPASPPAPEPPSPPGQASPSQSPSPPSAVLPPQGEETRISPPPQEDSEGVEGAAAPEASPGETRL